MSLKKQEREQNMEELETCQISQEPLFVHGCAHT